MSRASILRGSLVLVIVGTLSWTVGVRGDAAAAGDSDKEIATLKQQLAEQRTLNAKLMAQNDALVRQLKDLGEQLKKIDTEPPKIDLSKILPPTMPAPRALGRSVPDDWNEQQFNGMPFYIIPLQQSGSR